MKSKYITSIIVALALVSVSLPLASVGCKSATKQAMVVSSSTHAAASLALQSWNQHIKQVQQEVDLLAQTNPAKAQKRASETTNEIAQVRAAWDKYQASQLAVLNAAQQLSKVPSGDPSAPVAQDRLTLAMNASAIILSEVVGLLEKYGIAVK